MNELYKPMLSVILPVLYPEFNTLVFLSPLCINAWASSTDMPAALAMLLISVVSITALDMIARLAITVP